MRILLVTNGLTFGGAERIVEALAVGLRNAGDDVRVVATTRDGPVGDAIRAQGIRVDVLGIRHAFDVRVPFALAKVIAEHRSDVVHSHLAVADVASVLATRRADRPRLVTTIHSPYVGIRPALRALWGRVLPRFDEVIAVSHEVARGLPRTLSPRLIHPSLVDEADEVWTRQRARRHLGISDHVPLVLGLGRLVPVKGFDVLAEAAGRLVTPNVVVAVIGDGPERERLLGTRLKLLGAMENAGILLAAADLFVSPSRSEGFPQAPIHAMLAKVPIVATRVGGTPEVVEHDVTGVLVEPEDPRALAEAIDALLADPTRRNRLAQAGPVAIQQRTLTRQQMVAGHRALYEGRMTVYNADNSPPRRGS